MDLLFEPARDMGGFPPGSSSKQANLDEQSAMIKLDSNENPFGPSPAAVAVMRGALETCSCSVVASTLMTSV